MNEEAKVSENIAVAHWSYFLNIMPIFCRRCFFKTLYRFKTQLPSTLSQKKERKQSHTLHYALLLEVREKRECACLCGLWQNVMSQAAHPSYIPQATCSISECGAGEGGPEKPFFPLNNREFPKHHSLASPWSLQRQHRSLWVNGPTAQPWASEGGVQEAGLQVPRLQWPHTGSIATTTTLWHFFLRQLTFSVLPGARMIKCKG